MKLIDAIESLVSGAIPYGSRITSLGSRLHGHVPHVAPEAWFHVLHKGLDKKEIDGLQDSLGISIPDDFRNFLAYANGTINIRITE
jgi:hypothetical protein